MQIQELFYHKNSGRFGSSNGSGEIQDFTGTDGVFPGTAGLVPAPQPGDENKYLRGGWQVLNH